MSDIKLIALDLDGTLLNSQKLLSSANRAALERAHRAGVEIVPATGRFYTGMPSFIRELPFVRYCISINGAAVVDMKTGETLYEACIETEDAVRVMRVLDTLPCIYDCYQNNWGLMTEALQKQSELFAPSEHYVKMLYELRRPVPELKQYLSENQLKVQKIQAFFKDMDLRAAVLKLFPDIFPNLLTVSSVVNNIEINAPAANKGDALRALAAHLGLDISETMACGDMMNDASMLEAAGLGVAMANAEPEVLALADFVTRSNDDDGIAYAINKLVFSEES